MASREQLRYPAVAVILKRELERIYQDEQKDLKNQAAVAKECGYSAGTFSAYVTGEKGPDQKFITNFLSTVTAIPKRRSALATEIWDAAQKTETHYTSILDKLEAGGSLTYTTIDYAPFAGPAGPDGDCFFESVFASRFFDTAGITVEPLGPRRGLRPEDYKKADVALGLYDSADRMLRLGLKFWRVPIRMGLGAVCLKKYQPHLSSIALVLSGVKPKTSRSIRPIVVANDVGSLHCRKRLKFDDHELEEVKNLDVKALTERLISETNTAGVAIPVICTDEYTALRVLGKLGDEACSVFPLNSRFASQDWNEHARRELPQYFCSLAIDRSDYGFQDFMQDALTQFLSTEIETTANGWFHLATSLQKTVAGLLRAMRTGSHDSSGDDNPRMADAKRWASAWEWVFYTLTLYTDSIDSFASFNTLPWKPILQRARQLVQHEIAKDELLPDVVKAFREDREEQDENNSYGLDKLCSVLDVVELGPDVKTRDNMAFTLALRQVLRGAQPDLHIFVKECDPTVDSTAVRVAARAMRGFMRNLQNLYDATGHADAVTRLRKDIDNLETVQTEYGGESGLILLAWAAEEREKFVGGLCIRGVDSKRAELRYLWVEPHYRGRNIGKSLIEKATTILREPMLSKVTSKTGTNKKARPCEAVYVEVLKEEEVLQTAAKLFTELGFVKTGTKAERDEYSLTLVAASA